MKKSVDKKLKELLRDEDEPVERDEEDEDEGVDEGDGIVKGIVEMASIVSKNEKVKFRHISKEIQQDILNESETLQDFLYNSDTLYQVDQRRERMMQERGLENSNMKSILSRVLEKLESVLVVSFAGFILYYSELIQMILYSQLAFRYFSYKL